VCSKIHKSHLSSLSLVFTSLFLVFPEEDKYKEDDDEAGEEDDDDKKENVSPDLQQAASKNRVLSTTLSLTPSVMD
jgi:hypothetical protein